jgi:hypothetical protein
MAKIASTLSCFRCNVFPVGSPGSGFVLGVVISLTYQSMVVIFDNSCPLGALVLWGLSTTTSRPSTKQVLLRQVLSGSSEEGQGR